MKVGYFISNLFIPLAQIILFCTMAEAACPAFPYNITNGTPADATQVMQNFNQLLNCINTGNITIPPTAEILITSPQGNNTSLKNPSSNSNYNFNLPATAGSAGQALFSGGGGSNQMYWAPVPTAVSPPLIDGIPIGRPAASSFVWRNGGSSTYAEYANGPITLTIPSQNGDQIRGFEISPPTQAPYTVTAKLDTLLWGKSYFTIGIYAVDSNGKILSLVFGIDNGSSGLQTLLQVVRWNSVSNFNSVQIGKPISAARVLWFRMKNDGTNWNFFVSHNGADWIQFFSDPLNAFLGPNISGIGVYGNNNDTSNVSLPSFVSIWSFEIASGDGSNSHW